MNNTQLSSEKKLTLLLLCLLFGIFGVHRFYTGKHLTGGFQLLLIALVGLILGFEVKSLWPLGIATCGIFLLWWIVDILRIIMGKFTDKEGRPIIDWA